MSKFLKISVLVLVLTMAVISFYSALAADTDWRAREGMVSGVILDKISGDLNKTFPGTYLVKTEDGQTLAFRIISRTAFDAGKNYGSYKNGDSVIITYDTTTVNELGNTYDATSIQIPVASKTVDYTPRVATWYGKVNQHVEIATGKWKTDSDGVSGANINLLTYCKKWYPKTFSYKEYKKETITFYDRGNKQTYWPIADYTREVPSYECVQGEGTKQLPDLTIEDIKFSKELDGDINVFTASLCNRSLVDAQADQVTGWLTDNIHIQFNLNGMKNSLIINGDFKAGECRDASMSLDTSIKYKKFKSGYYKITVDADYNKPYTEGHDVVKESNENNNSLTKSLYLDLGTTANSCTMDYTPVCGIDGKTYSNSCSASQNKVKVDYQGECKKKDVTGLPDLIIQDLVSFENYGDASNSYYRYYFTASNIGLAESIDMGNIYGYSYVLKSSNEVIKDQGSWYGSINFKKGEIKKDKHTLLKSLVKAGDTLVLKVDPDNYRVESNESNNEKSFVITQEMLDKVNGKKDDKSDDDNLACTTDYAPVCGTDGQTYSNSCSASQNKVKVDYSGECKKSDNSNDEDIDTYTDNTHKTRDFYSTGAIFKGFDNQRGDECNDNNNCWEYYTVGKAFTKEAILEFIKTGSTPNDVPIPPLSSFSFNEKSSGKSLNLSGIKMVFKSANDNYALISFGSQDYKITLNDWTSADRFWVKYEIEKPTIGDAYSLLTFADKYLRAVYHYCSNGAGNGYCKFGSEKNISKEKNTVNPPKSSETITQPTQTFASDKSSTAESETADKPKQADNSVYQPKSTIQAKPVLSSIKGKIVLQVEKNGEAYYASPKTNKVYYLKDGNSAYQTMKETGAGINEADFINLMSSNTKGQELRKRFAGQIVLRVKAKGEAYYINPANLSVTYMPDGNAAYQIMRQQGLGITDENLSKVIDVQN